VAEHRIQLNSSEPIRSRAYKLPYHLTEAVDKEIDELLRLGFIEPCEGTAYASPIVVVQKRDSQGIRLCVNYKKINATTVFDPQPVPETEDILVIFSGCRYFSSMDFCKGYYTAPVADDSKIIQLSFVTGVFSGLKYFLLA